METIRQREQFGAEITYKGQPEGKVGMKVLQLWLCEPETPPSPEAKRMDVPRAPSCM